MNVCTMKKSLYLILCIVAAIVFSPDCNREIKKQEKIVKKPEDEKVKLLLNSMLEVNRCTPKSFSADFTIDGRFHNK